MTGLSKDTIKFLKDLKANNNRDWFQANKKTYEAMVKSPAAEVGAALNEQIEMLAGTPYRAKIFRINRDVRFSKDKTPYNTHVHMAFSPEDGGPIKPMWFFGLDTEKLVLGAGVFEFPKDRLESWRERVASEEGEELLEILVKLKRNGARVGEPALKRVPKPYDADHPREELLRHKGLAVWLDAPNQDFGFGDKAAANCAKEFRKLLPLVNWLGG
ncbi:MAG: DUF2461 domain-containing protein [Rhizobiaceae bacterium]